MTVTAAASMVPEFGNGPDARTDLMAAITEGIGNVLRQYVADAFVSIPMSSHIAIAR